MLSTAAHRCFPLLVAALALAGCAASQQQRVYAAAAFDHRVATSHVELYWICSQPEPGVLRVEGLAENTWQAQPVRFFELELVGVDDADRVVTGTSGAVADMQIRTNQHSPFRLDLRTTGRERRYDLFYQYQFDEPELQTELWPTAFPRVASQLQRFTVRDVCSPTQHRSR